MQNLKFILLLSLGFLISCGEEVLTQNTQAVNVKGGETTTFEVSTCSQMHFDKPAVDILYIIDNSGSTLAGSFQAIKGEIQKTVSTISSEFDYHIYFAPLNAGASDTINGYPILTSDSSTLNNPANLNVLSPDQFNNFNMFAQASGNNQEWGFQRAQQIIGQNRNLNNNIFRDKSHLIVVMISNGDDNQSIVNVGGNMVPSPGIFNGLKDNFKSLLNPPVSAQTFRFISLVAHSNCHSWKTGTYYKKMSNELYSELGYSDNNSTKDSHDLCSGNYSSLFSAVNNSIHQVLVGHKYDHWKISSASSSSIQEDDITLTRVSPNGQKANIPQSSSNGFEYIGHKVNQPTRYEPTVGEEQTGLMVKLNGTARVEYPDCVIAKTRTPTEYFGFIALPNNPDLATVEVKIDGVVIDKSDSNGWSFIGWHEQKNIKVPGPTNAAVTPELKKSGYMLQLNGSAIYTNGQTISVYYKPKAI